MLLQNTQNTQSTTTTLLQLNFDFLDNLGSITAYKGTVSNISEIDRLTAEQYLALCNTCLLTAPKLLDDLCALGVIDPNVVAKHFGIGYGARKQATSSSCANRDEYAALRGSYQRTGIYKPNGLGALWGQYTFPLFDKTGKLIGVFAYYRCPSANHTRMNIVLFPDVEVGIFNYDSLINDEVITLTNSPLVACQLYSSENPNVSAIVSKHLDVMAFIKFLKGLPMKKVFICVDPGRFNDYWKSELTKALNALRIEYKDVS